MKKQAILIMFLLLLALLFFFLFNTLFYTPKPIPTVVIIKKDLPVVKVEQIKKVVKAEQIKKVDIVSVNAIDSKLKVGNKATIKIILKNSGEVKHEFFVSGSVKFSGNDSLPLQLKKTTINSGEIAEITYDYNIPESGKEGSYVFSAVAGTAVNDDATVGGTKSERACTFYVSGLSIEGIIASLDIETGKKYFGDKVAIKAVFKNSGEAAHKFPCKITVLDPTGKTYIVLDEPVYLTNGTQEEKVIAFKINPSMIEGIYAVQASIAKATGESCGSATGIFTVTDKFPSFVYYVGVPPSTVGEIGQITALVRDDKELKEVKLRYQGPGMTESKLVEMTKLSGTEREAIYQITLKPFTETGILKYSVELKDSKGQCYFSQGSTEEIKAKAVTAPSIIRNK